MKRAAALLLLTAMLLGLCACGKPAQTPAEDTPPAEEAAQAPRNEVSVIPGEGGTFVRTAEGTGAAMLDVDHWIREGDDAVLMDEAAIRRFNGENAVPICASDGNAAPPLGEMGETLDGSIVVSLLSCETLPEDPSALYLGGVPTTAEYWNGLMEQVDIPGVGDQVSVRFGYSVTRTTLRKFPSADRIYESPDDRYYDYMHHRSPRPEAHPGLPPFPDK